MNKNIVFFDIDGTLLSEKTKLIPDSTREAIKLMRENGHLAFINTGRPMCELTPYIKEIGFDGFICGCGTHIELNGEVLFHKSLGKDLSKKVALDMKEFKLEGLLEGRYDVYWDKPENIQNKSVKRIIEQHKYEGFYTGSTWYDPNIEYDKLVIFVEEYSDFDGFYEKYKNIFEFIKRDNNFYELVPLGYSKATGIQYLEEHLNIPHENTYAIGDSTNDLSMLDYAGTSIAMGNSTPSILDKVSYVTDDVDDNGIYNALKHYKMF